MIDFEKLDCIYEGAEAKIYKIRLLNNEVAILKERIPKRYRESILDKKLISERVKKEVKIYEKLAKNGINSPRCIDFDVNKGLIIMTYFDMPSLRKIIQDNPSKIELLASAIAKMHISGISHGDLTLENVLYNKNSDDVVLIDFGLSNITKRYEDYATDIYVFKETLLAEFDLKVWKMFFSKYSSIISEEKQEIIERFRNIEKRRKYAN